MKSSLSLVVAVVLAVLGPVALSGESVHAAPVGLATVRWVWHGLAVTPPGGSAQQGRVKMPLYGQYGLRTARDQKASIGFRDGTVVHFNQDTDALLRDPHTLHVSGGEVAQFLAPGTNHRVETDSAAAVATGTTFDVRVAPGGGSTFVVLHGALQVSNTSGAVVVKSSHESIVPVGKAPGAPRTVDPATLKADFAWTDGIPTPDLGEDITLDANSGTIEGFSSQNGAGGSRWHVEHINDGLLSQGWESADGAVQNQFVKFGFDSGNAYRISGVVIDPAATGGDSADADLKDFEIRTSSTGTAESDFTTIFHGTCLQRASLQRFQFPVAVRARYIELVALNNYGSPRHLAVAEFEAVATASLFASPTAVAVDTHGNMYVADPDSNHIQKLSPKGKSLAVWGNKGQGKGQFLDPSGVAVDTKGNVYVADTSNHRIQKLSPQGTSLAIWGGFGTEQGRLEFPQAIAVGPDGNLYIADAQNNRIVKMSTSGTWIASWGTIDTFFNPGAVALDRHGNIYVADTSNSRVVKLSPSGTVMATWTGFDTPQGIAVDSHGSIFVADSYNDRVVKLSPVGAVVATWGKLGGSPGQFLLPAGLSMDTHNNLYVADMVNSRVQKLSPAGKVLGVWGRYATVPQVLGQPAGLAVGADGSVYITDDQNDRIQTRAPDGSVTAVIGYHGFAEFEHTAALGQFYAPHGIALDSHGTIYVADTFNDRIQILTDAGPVSAFGSHGSGPGQFDDPRGVAVDAQGNIYVADQRNNRVEKFSAAGAFIAQWGTKGTGPGQLDGPEGIATGPDGNVYVADTNNQRVEEFTPDGRYLAIFGSRAQGLYDPSAVAVDPHGNLWIAAADVVEISPANTVLVDWSLPGPFTFASSIALDPAGNVYAGDFFNKQVVKFSASGDIVATWS